jgi:hypothetical protein
MPIKEAPRCIECERIYVEGRAGVCSACLQAKRKGRRYQRRAGIPCDCGGIAVTVILIKVGTEKDGITTVRMPLCGECLKLEQELQERN